MKRLISSIMSIAIILAMMTVSFAAVSFDDTTATTASLSFGGYTTLNVPAADAESFDVNVVINPETVGFDIDTIELWFDVDGVSIENLSAPSAIGPLGTDVGEGIVYTTAGDLATASDFEAANNILGTLTLKKTTDGKTATISFTAGSTYLNGGDYTDEGFASLTIKFEEGGSGSTDIIVDEENFASATDDSYTSADVISGDVKVNGNVIATMGEGGKIHTYFNKNTAGKVLEAEKYGIEATINGKTFRFPGKTAVSADKAWAIKLVIPTGKFSDGVAASVENITAYTID